MALKLGNSVRFCAALLPAVGLVACHEKPWDCPAEQHGSLTPLFYLSTSAVQGLALEGDDLFFMNVYDIKTVPKALEGEPTTVEVRCMGRRLSDYQAWDEIDVWYPDPTLVADHHGAATLVVSNGRVFWSEALSGAAYASNVKAVKSVRTDGSDPIIYASGTPFVGGFELGKWLTVAGGFIYFNARLDGQSGIWRSPVTGGEPELWVEDEWVRFDMVSNETAIFWDVLPTEEERETEPERGNRIKMKPHDGGPVSVVVDDAGRTRRLAVDDAHVYWTGGAGVMRAPIAGGEPVIVVTGQWYPRGLALDNTHVYWADSLSSGAIRKAPKSGGPITELAWDIEDPWSVVVDDTWVYWNNYGSYTGSFVTKTLK